VLLALQLVAVGGLVAHDGAARARADAPPADPALFRPAVGGAAVGAPAAGVPDSIAAGPWGEGCEGNCGGLRREP
jgi:hypothetical protein